MKSLAGAYISSINKLGMHFSKIAFIAVTAPLTTVQSGAKAWLKQVLRRAALGYSDNARWQHVNTIMRDKYATQGHLFDLAKAESESSARFQYEDGSFEALNPVITSDSGHLTSQGERLVTTKSLKFIAKLPSLPH